ncbi:hypothetical protein [Rhodovulum steppense]|uniref:Uncharacterized protein n=1 Tax=Rhodovulum steppense TaxID=540251 RepID=A0A4R1Z0D0_9RHOB|nr:hypothetical protein [Rhodovulum steppense]TCM86998.1 hypothetical protein EV216_10376 [Rhodovulum steppense]
MITLASLLGLMMVSSTVDFSDALDRIGGSDDDDVPGDEPEDYRGETLAFGFGLDDLLAHAVSTDAFAETEVDLAHYLANEAACDAMAEGAQAADMSVGSNLDDWLAMTSGAPTLIDDYDELEDALFVVYDAETHPDPVLSVGPSDTGAEDATILLDGMPLAVVSGGAGLDLSMVSLVPTAQFPAALAAGA